MIRHDNGYVTVYADNDELLVKEGDKVRRGQIIAKSGQTGGARLRACISNCARTATRSIP